MEVNLKTLKQKTLPFGSVFLFNRKAQTQFIHQIVL